MSRTLPKHDSALNLSTSSISLSEVSESELEPDEVDDIQLERILAKETKNYEFLDVLPPTPQRPTTRSRTRSSVSPAVSSIFSTPPKKYGRKGDRSIKKFKCSPDSIGSSSISSRSVDCRTKKVPKSKKSEKDICRELGIDLADSEFEDIENEDDEDERNRVHVDNIIDDLLNFGLGKKKKYGKIKAETVEEEKLQEQYQKLRRRAPLEINGDGRCDVLNEDIQTVKATLESVNALISVLEKTRDKLINKDKNLVYTEPPVRVKKKTKPSQASVILS